MNEATLSNMLSGLITKTSLILLLTLLLTLTAHAQSEINIKGKYTHIKSKELHFNTISNFNTELSMKQLKLTSTLNLMSDKPLIESNTLNLSTIKKFETDYFLNLGGFENYTYIVDIQATRNTNIRFDFGLIKQYSNFSAQSPNFHLNFGTQVEQKINSWLYLYKFGKYLTKPINQNKQFDPIIYMNPMFKQSEIEIGLRTKYKNLEADFGTKTIFDTQFQKSKPLNLMNSKINIGF